MLQDHLLVAVQILESACQIMCDINALHPKGRRFLASAIKELFHAANFFGFPRYQRSGQDIIQPIQDHKEVGRVRSSRGNGPHFDNAGRETSSERNLMRALNHNHRGSRLNLLGMTNNCEKTSLDSQINNSIDVGLHILRSIFLQFLDSISIILALSQEMSVHEIPVL
jgi:hypothetical protein